MDRTAIITGPAFIEFDGGKFYSKGDIQTGIDIDTFDIMTSAHGKVDERTENVNAKLSFEPIGEWEHLGVLWPYGSTVVGASLLTGTDKPLKIHALDGTLYTFKASAVTRMPTITCSATKTLIGAVEFTCVRSNNTAWSGVDSFFTITPAGASPEDALVPANIKTQPYTVAWGSTPPWNSIDTAEGVEVDFNLGITPISTDSVGIVDLRFQQLGVMAKLIPLGPTEAEILTALKIQGVGAARGRSLLASAEDLVISGTGVTVTVKNAQLKSGGYRFGATTIRNGELGFVATKKFTAGVGDPLFTVA